jgi:hypothetical protein
MEEIIIIIFRKKKKNPELLLQLLSVEGILFKKASRMQRRSCYYP